MFNLAILQGIGILLVFVILVGLMMARKMSTIIALPVMAILFGLIAGVPIISDNPETYTIASNILGEGSMRLSTAIAGLIFGSMFGQLLNKVGVTKGIIRKAAELAGDKPLFIAIAFFVTGSIIISASGGLGMVILIGTIMIPIMLTTGIAPLTAAIVILLSVGVGALFNVSNWAVYTDVLGLSVSEIADYTLISAVPLILVGLVMITYFVKRDSHGRKAWAMKEKNDTGNEKQAPTIALISPLIPVVLVFAFSLDIVAAITGGILITLILARPKRPIHALSSAFVEGIQETAGAIALMIGIGILLNAVMAPEVSAVISPFIEMIIPTSMLGYILLFTILSPLAIYRGPLNVFGLGSGIAALLVASGLSPLASMIALRNVSNFQAVGDPTNSHNVWLADYTKVDVNDILKQTAVWLVIIVFISMIIGGVIVF